MPTSVKIVPKRPRARAPHNRLVVALAYDGLCTFEFGVAVEIFGLARPEMGEAWYRFRVAAIEPGPLRAAGGIRIESRRRPASGGARRHHHRSRLARRRGARAGAVDRGPAARAQARRAPPVVLLGCVRAGGDRAARRQAGNDALALRRAPGPRLSRHLRGARRALHRRGQSAHRRRQRGRHRLEPPPHSPRLGRGGSQQRGASPRRAAAPRRRPGAVHRGAGARGQGRAGASGRCSSACAPSRPRTRPSQRWRKRPG